MKIEDLIAALRRLKVQTGSLACLGCGHEHNCSTSGCAIIREAVDELCGMRWIDAEVELPTTERPVLTFIGYRDTGIGFITTSSYFRFDTEPHWQWDGLVRDEQRVLFWMPLPEPPEEG